MGRVPGRWRGSSRERGVCDQEAAIDLVMDCVANSRDLSKSIMHELHVILTRHQETTTAIDSLGMRREIELRRGSFKQHPNNPRRSDGSMHEYCPPIQVESEIECLLQWQGEYRDRDPVLVAAWFHHRFTQIHPYQDGNGRVGRALLTLMMLRSELMPVVIDRDMRVKYITSLERADRGDLSSLVQFFAGLERSALLRALSIEADSDVATGPRLTDVVIGNIAARLSRRKLDQEQQLRQVDELARTLRERARTLIENGFNALKEPLSAISEPEVHVQEGGPDRGNAHWYKHEVIRSGRGSGKFVNFKEAHHFIKASFRIAEDRLVFVTSFHHVGRELSGFVEVTAFALLEAWGEAEESGARDRTYIDCSLDPFVIAWNVAAAEVERAFDDWLDQALAVAVKELGDRL